MFAVLLSASLVLFRLAIPSAQGELAAGSASPSRRRSVEIALGLVPFAGIAFLWFIGVVRDRIGDEGYRFFATVFLGSGLLFVAMFFVSSAIFGGIIAGVTRSGGSSLDPSVLAFCRRLTYLISTVYGLRMADFFGPATSTVLSRERVAPRWICDLRVRGRPDPAPRERPQRQGGAGVPDLGVRLERAHPARELPRERGARSRISLNDD